MFVAPPPVLTPQFLLDLVSYRLVPLLFIVLWYGLEAWSFCGCNETLDARHAAATLEIEPACPGLVLRRLLIWHQRIVTSFVGWYPVSLEADNRAPKYTRSVF